MVDRYYVEVKVREGKDEFWRRVHPVGGDPYIMTRDEAQRYVEVYGLAYPGKYRMVEAEETFNKSGERPW